jgi:molybdopterin/thiamine biosynthesis adenylyltransferase
MKFTKQQIERYSRQIILKKIGVIGQKKLLKSSVLIVGAGGLGSPIAIYLTALGIGKIAIIDKDNIEISNLNRQIIFSTNDLKKNKSTTAINKLRKINQDIQLRCF